MKTTIVPCLLVAAASMLLVSGCVGGAPASESAGEAASELTSTGLHGTLGSVSSGSVVKEGLAKQLSDNPHHAFWWFCGQAATATAINFARGASPTDEAKVMQLQWIHDRLKDLHAPAYSVNDSEGPYAVRIDWLFDLMKNEKSNEFETTWLTSSDRESAKANMMKALDSGAYVVGLNRTSDTGPGHFLTVYAIDYQPTAAGGGTVYFGDVLSNKLDTANFKDFLDRMLSQSEHNLYNAFSVKKK
jgi:hypothetical protein